MAKQLVVEEELKRAGVTIRYVTLRLGDTAEDHLLKNMRSAIASLPTQTLSPDEAARVTHGNPVDAVIAGQRAALVDNEGRLAAIAVRSGTVWQPTTVFAT